MPALTTEGISLHYDTFGDHHKPPLLLLVGLSGAGAAFGRQAELFAKDHFVILPDHRGAGRSSRTNGGYTIQQHAKDMASLLQHLALDPAHVVGSSTGGAIGQIMALDHPQQVRTLTMASSFARVDAYFRRQFTVRRKLIMDADLYNALSCSVLFLFAPEYASKHPERVEEWVTGAVAQTDDREISAKRIDMILAHDCSQHLRSIRQPVLVICGDQDFCTPLYLSEEIARDIPGAELVVLPGAGHLVYLEQEDRFFQTVRAFIGRH